MGDSCFQFSLGYDGSGRSDRHFYEPHNLIFDDQRDHLLVADRQNNRIMVFSAEDGSLIAKLDSSQQKDFCMKQAIEQYILEHESLYQPCGLAIDHKTNRLFALDNHYHRICVWSLTEIPSGSRFPPQIKSSPTFVKYHDISSTITTTVREFLPGAIAIDNFRNRMIIINGNYLSVFSLDNFSHLSNLFNLRGGVYGASSGGIKIDPERDRLYILNSSLSFVMAFSLGDGHFLFEIPLPQYETLIPGRIEDSVVEILNYRALCIDNKGRIIITNKADRCLDAFSPDGKFIDRFICPGWEQPISVAFNFKRGLIAYGTSKHQVHVIAPNQWLPDTFPIWNLNFRHYAPNTIKKIVMTLTMIRALGENCLYPTIILLPNELLFMIFEYL